MGRKTNAAEGRRAPARRKTGEAAAAPLQVRHLLERFGMINRVQSALRGTLSVEDIHSIILTVFQHYTHMTGHCICHPTKKRPGFPRRFLFSVTNAYAL